MRLRLIAFILICLLAVPTFGQALTAEVDRTEVGLGETLTLRLRLEGARASGSPDFSTLAGQFDILTNQRSLQHNIINGQVSASTEWTLILSPRNLGELLVPPFSIEGQSSEPISVRVVDSLQQAGGGKDVYLESEIDKSSAYVQEQVIVTYRLFYNRNVDNLEKPNLDLPAARVQELPRVEYQRTIGHTAYGVAEFKYAIFPDASGTLVIPDAVWTVRTNDMPNVGRFGFSGGRYQVYRPRTEELTLEVKSRPAEYPANQPWLPASEVSISEDWSRSPEHFTQGEPLTRTITIEAEGARSEQLPPVVVASKDGDFRFYPDQPQQDNQVNARGVRGVRKESTAIVPSQSGALTLPEVSVTWWDTNKQQVRVATLPARSIQVSGRPLAEAPQEPAIAGESQSPTEAQPGASRIQAVWFLVIAASALALVFAALWWRQRQAKEAARSSSDPRHSKQVSRHQAFERVTRLCRERRLPELRLAILQWGRTNWPHEPNLSLSKIAAKSQNPRLAQELLNLDAQLYGAGRTPVDTAVIEAGLKPLNQKAATPPASKGLRPLYGE